MLENIKKFYKENPKVQLFVFLLGIGVFIFVAYWFTTQNTSKYQSLGNVDFKMTKEEKPKPKKEPKKNDDKVKKASSTQSSAPQQPKPPKSEENEKNLHEIRKKRFDSDIEKQFEFLNKF